jgi:DNA-binding PadR family transcriptional regulator
LPELRPRFGLELVRDLAAADGLLSSDGTVYPLLNRLRDAGLVTSEWRDDEGERARRYYSITEAGRQSLTAFRADWARADTHRPADRSLRRREPAARLRKWRILQDRDSCQFPASWRGTPSTPIRSFAPKQWTGSAVSARPRRPRGASGSAGTSSPPALD